MIGVTKMTNEELKAAIGTLRYHIEINANQDWFLRDHGPSLLQAARELSQLKDGTHPDMVMVPRCKEEPQVSKFIHRRIADTQKGNVK